MTTVWSAKNGLASVVSTLVGWKQIVGRNWSMSSNLTFIFLQMETDYGPGIKTGSNL